MGTYYIPNTKAKLAKVEAIFTAGPVPADIAERKFEGLIGADNLGDMLDSLNKIPETAKIDSRPIFASWLIDYHLEYLDEDEPLSRFVVVKSELVDLVGLNRPGASSQSHALIEEGAHEELVALCDRLRPFSDNCFQGYL